MSQDAPEPQQAKVVACIGNRCYTAHIVSLEPENPADRAAVVTIAETELLANPPDLSARVQIFDGGTAKSPANRVFTGYVLELVPDADDRWRLNIAKLATWQDRTTGAATFGPDTGPDIFYSIYRSNGMPARFILPRWDPPEEPFIVVVPLEGIQVHGDIQGGPVRITAKREIAEQFRGEDSPAIHEEFHKTGVWAAVVVRDQRMHDAEQRGLAQVQLVLDRLALASRFSWGRTPSGDLRSFRRTQSLERLRLVPIVGVLGMGTGRRWLRGYSYTAVVSPVSVAEAMNGLENSIGPGDVRTHEAINAWRRATLADDPTTTIIALSEACEFYANGVPVPKKFTKADITAITSAASEGLSGEKLDRVKTLVANLNVPSFRARLVAGLAIDNVPHDRSEIDLLVRLYKLRSKILHGSERVLPNEDELRQAVAFVNRMIVFRLHRLQAQFPR